MPARSFIESVMGLIPAILGTSADKEIEEAMEDEADRRLGWSRT